MESGGFWSMKARTLPHRVRLYVSVKTCATACCRFDPKCTVRKVRPTHLAIFACLWWFVFSNALVVFLIINTKFCQNLDGAGC